jgi:hypothetical protein
MKRPRKCAPSSREGGDGRLGGTDGSNPSPSGGESVSAGLFRIGKRRAHPIYVGQIAHKGQLYPGQHPPLIDTETWNAVRDQLFAKRHRSRGNAAEPSLLAGLLFDA